MKLNSQVLKLQFTKLLKIYKTLCILFATTTFLFVIGNMLALKSFKTKPPYQRQLDRYARRDPKELKEIYPTLTREHVSELLRETWDQPFQFEAFTGFKEKPRNGKYVNVSDEGFRYSRQQRATLRDKGVKVFVFGGSTTFGYGLDDSSTIPAHLETKLKVRYSNKQITVFNFGRAYYYSAQESILFQKLLVNGNKPDVAIFIDGLNEGQESPFFSREMSYLFNAYNYSSKQFAALILQKLPILNLIQTKPKTPKIVPMDAERIMAEYSKRKDLILTLSKEFHVLTYFFIQPIPGYQIGFEKERDRSAQRAQTDNFRVRNIKVLDTLVDDVHVFSLTGILKDYKQRPFIDRFHYTASVCGLIAESIAEKIEIQ